MQDRDALEGSADIAKDCTVTCPEPCPVTSGYGLSASYFRAIREHLSTGMAAKLDRDLYIFDAFDMCWMPACSPIGVYSMSLWGENAWYNKDAVQLVQADKNLAPFLPTIKKYSPDVETHVPTVSFRKGRYKIEMSGSTLTAKYLDTLYALRNTLCRCEGRRTMSVMPVGSSAVSETVDLSDMTCPVSDSLQPLFGCPGDYSAFMWFVGNAIVDPVKAGRVCVLVGDGREGKSVIMDASSILGDYCRLATLQGALFGSSIYLDDRTVTELSSMRIGMCTDVAFCSSPLNARICRLLTSGDVMRAEVDSHRLRTSILLSSEDLPRCDTDWLHPATLKHMMILPMAASCPEIDDVVATSQDPLDHARWIARCIGTRMSHKFPPLSTNSLLHTLCGDETHEVLDFIAVTDVEPTLEQLVAADWTLRSMLKLGEKALDSILRHYDPSLSRVIGSRRVVNMVKCVYCSDR